MKQAIQEIMFSRARRGLSCAAMALAIAAGLPAQAAEIGGLDIGGDTRFGAYSSPAGTPRGGYTLGGDTQKFRLGNEGDNGIELGIGNSLGFDASVMY